jgi:hypothetical protein
VTSTFIYATIELKLIDTNGSLLFSVLTFFLIQSFHYLQKKREKDDFHERFLKEKNLEQYKFILNSILPLPILIVKKTIQEKNP